MKIIFTLIVAVLMLPSMALAGTLDIGFRQIEQEQTERVYHLGLDHSKDGFSLQGDLNYGELGDSINTDDARLSLGYDVSLRNKRWQLWFDETVKYDRPAGTELENLAGLGPKYILYMSDKVRASLSFGYLVHYQALIDGTHESLERWSWRFKIKVSTEEKEAGLVSMYQPAIKDPDDYTLGTRAWYSILITETVDLKLSVIDEYRAVPDKRKLSQMITAVYKF